MAKRLKMLMLAALLAPAGALWAQNGAIDARTFDQLTKAQELAAEDRHDDALYILDRLKERGRLNSYATAQLWNFYAFIYASRDEYQQAIDAYFKVMEQEDASNGLVLTAKYTIAQLYFQMEQYGDCIRFMNEWLETADKPTPTAHIMLAQAYYQTHEYDRAMTHVDDALALERAAGNRVQEGWLRLKAVLSYTKGDYASTAQTYEELISLYPNSTYLRQLAGMYSETGQGGERLAVFDALYEHGALKTESDLLNLAYMWQGEQVPYKAGRIIEQGMAKGAIEESPKNVESLANAWAQANEYEKAIPTLSKAAQISGDGLYYARLAGVHFNAGDYAAAAEAAIQADQQGGLKNPAGNLMLLGMAYFNDRKYEPALQAFRRAKQSRDTFASANKWESYTLKEIERIRELSRSQDELEQRTREAIESRENNLNAIGIGS
ncbi:MAG: hypothetical protein EVA65_14715 [Oceanococcus sp.]|nr:MAG: hypothetical protein EVA65_14715 [Oceanococcus sp.]